MEQTATLLMVIGIFTFLGCGISVANSSEARRNEKTANVLTVFSVIGILMFIIGVILLIVSQWV